MTFALEEFRTLIVFVHDTKEETRPEGRVLVGTAKPVGSICWTDERVQVGAESKEVGELIVHKARELEQQGIIGPAFCEEFSGAGLTYQGKRLAAMPPSHLKKLLDELRHGLAFEE